MYRLFIVLFLAATSSFAWAQSDHASPYAGQEQREIMSFSAEDLAELQRGGGWGLAKPAELNGWPGPSHLLDLRDEIPLRADQVAALELQFQQMRRQAIEMGKRFIAREHALDRAFRARQVTPEQLHLLLEETEAARKDLRYVHLSAHLAATALLDAAQIERYNTLRGYADMSQHGGHTGHGASHMPQ